MLWVKQDSNANCHCRAHVRTCEAVGIWATAAFAVLDQPQQKWNDCTTRSMRIFALWILKSQPLFTFNSAS